MGMERNGMEWNGGESGSKHDFVDLGKHTSEASPLVCKAWLGRGARHMEGPVHEVKHVKRRLVVANRRGLASNGSAQTHSKRPGAWPHTS